MGGRESRNGGREGEKERGREVKDCCALIRGLRCNGWRVLRGGAGAGRGEGDGKLCIEGQRKAIRACRRANTGDAVQKWLGSWHYTLK